MERDISHIHYGLVQLLYVIRRARALKAQVSSASSPLAHAHIFLEISRGYLENILVMFLSCSHAGTPKNAMKQTAEKKVSFFRKMFST
jgi:hypothetical protein